MSEFINTIDVLGDNAVCDAIIDGTLSELCDNVITYLHGGVLRYCANLTYVNLPCLLSMEGQAFEGCKVLNRLVLSSETMCILQNTSAFNDSSIKTGTGYIYVPRALVDSYKTATNWSTYANQFRALEDYTVDGTVTGELDESKI